MCELFAMSARRPTTVQLSMTELGRHGGLTGPHRDGWGIGFVDGRDALVIREPAAASDSAWLAFVQRDAPRADIVLAHLRRATQGARLLRNTQPFARELGGRMHLFAHNGMVPGIEADPRFPARRFRAVGDTDSEHAFVALLDRLAPCWEHAPPSLDARLAVLVPFAAQLRELGPANFIYTDGDAVFAHGHRRRDDLGELRPPGLHVLCRRCREDDAGAPLAGVAIAHDAAQEVALVASVPLSAEAWSPVAEGEIVVLQAGRVVRRA
jgi:glutamine amidotransferase